MRFCHVGWCVALVLPSCIPSNVIAPKDRLVAVEWANAHWAPADASAIAGLYSSIALTGDVAAGIRKVYYDFEPDGRFTGAALVQRGGESTFEVLSGTWTLEGGSLRLGQDGEPAMAEMAPDLLRLSGEAGMVVLRREEAL
jgi:hypothetical protein